MSTQTEFEIERLRAARNKLRAKGVELGITTGTAKLDEIAEAFDEIVDQGDISAEVKEGETFTIPAGFHSGSGTVAGVSGGGNYKLQSKTVTPTKKQQSVTPDTGNYGLSDVIVQAIPDMYQDVTPVTAGAGDVLANKVIVNALGQTVAGTMPNNGKVTKTLAAGESVPIVKGYHDGEGKVTAQDLASQTEADAVANNILEGKTAWVDGEKLTGTIKNYGAIKATISSFATDTEPLGAITRSVSLMPGYYSSVNVEAVWAPKTQGSATPTKEEKTYTYVTSQSPNGYLPGAQFEGVYSSFTVRPIPDQYQDVTPVTAGAEDVLAGEVIVDAEGNEITGTMPNIGAQTASVNAGGSVTISKGYHDGTGKITGNSLASQTPGDAAAANILTGKKAWVAGSQVTGTMPNNGATGGTIDGLTSMSLTIPAGYTTGGTVSLTSDIEEALAAI